MDSITPDSVLAGDHVGRTVPHFQSADIYNTVGRTIVACLGISSETLG